MTSDIFNPPWPRPSMTDIKEQLRNQLGWIDHALARKAADHIAALKTHIQRLEHQLSVAREAFEPSTIRRNPAMIDPRFAAQQGEALDAANAKIASLEAAIRTTDEAHERKLATLASFTAALEAKIAEQAREIEKVEEECHYLNVRHTIKSEHLTAALARIETMGKALEPFAREAERYDPPEDDDDHHVWDCNSSELTVGNLRRARAAENEK